MSADFLLSLGLGPKVNVVNDFLRKTSLLTYVGKIRDHLKGGILHQISPFIIDVSRSFHDLYGTGRPAWSVLQHCLKSSPQGSRRLRLPDL
jgi:hypothetical protein